MPRIGTLTLMVLPLAFLPSHRGTGSRVPHKSLSQIHATSMPDAAQAVNRLPLGLSRVNNYPSVLTSFLRFRHFIEWFACARLFGHT